VLKGPGSSPYMAHSFPLKELLLGVALLGKLCENDKRVPVSQRKLFDAKWMKLMNLRALQKMSRKAHRV
jgi:hypothetical protein